MANDYVDRFIKQHKEYFQRNKKVIESNSWKDENKNSEARIENIFDQISKLKEKSDKKSQIEAKKLQKEVFEIKNSASRRKESLFDEETELTSSILGRLSAFIKETESSGDRKLPKVQSFIDDTVSIIDIHLNKCDEYLDYSMDELTEGPDNDDEVELRSDEIKFQDKVFNKKIKIQDTLNSLNITNSIENAKITFYKDQKASLPFMNVLPSYDDDIKQLTEQLDLPTEVDDITFHIHRDPKDVPKWNKDKHYWEQTEEVLKYWNNEWLKLTKGFTVDGYYFHPWLYFHLNFFKTPIPSEDGGDVIRVPDLRDNEWFIAEQLKAVFKEDGFYTKEALNIFGTRRFAKSVIMSSICEWRALIVPNVATAITSGSEGDLGELTHKIKTSMKVKEPAFIIPIQKQEWMGGTVEMGVKSDPSTLLEYSRHTIKNLAGGAKSSTQKTAGGAPSVFLIEEEGKFAWLKGYLAAKASFQAPFGLKTVIIVVGCVCAGTKVWTNKGILKNIEDLKKSDGILGYNGDTYSKEPITWMKNTEEKECIKITTIGGYSIECSTDHPFLMSTAKKINQNISKCYFKRADELEIGDSLFKPEKIDLFKKNRIEDARLLGLLVGDGYYAHTSPTLSIGDEEIFKYIKSNYDISIKKEFTQKNGNEFREVIIKNKTDLIKDMGMKGQSKDKKQIPKKIFESDENTVSEFLAGYFDADGSVYYSKVKKIVRISLCSVHRHLLEDVSYLLHKLGIHCTIVEEYNGYGKDEEYKGSSEYCYVLYINRVKDVKTFYEKIQLLCKHKTEKIVKSFSREYKHSAGFRKEMTFKFDEDYRKGKFFKDKKVNNLNSYRIIDIEYIGKKPVYNLTAGKTNTYLANGFVTHNTSGETSLAGDALKAVSNPTKYKFREMDWDLLESKLPKDFKPTWKRRQFATFIPGQMGYKSGFKRIPRKFGEFLGIKSDYLDKITIYQTDWVNNTKIILEERKKAEGDTLLLQQETVQYPIDPEETFISAEKNPFNYEQARKHKEYLEETGLWDRRRELVITNGGKLAAELSNKELAPYPHPGGTVEAPILVFEDIPEERPVDNLYVCSFDDVKQDDSDTDSLISFQVWKMDTFGDEFGDSPVLTWACRPGNRREMYETWLLIQKTYNAKAFPENEDMGYKTFLENKHLDEIWLLQAVDFTASMNIANNGKRKYGWTPRQSKRILLGMFIEMCNEVIEVEQDDGTTVSMYGVQKINDIGLLDEIINYKEDGNFDRISAALGAVGWMHYLKKNWILPKMRKATNNDTAKKKIKKSYSPYTKSKGAYTKSRRK